MKIKEITIDRYGPLPKNNFKFSEGINLIYGPNGSGKSLIIESIFKFLLGRNCCFDEEDRIDEEPEGYIVVQRGDEEVKLERDQTIQEIFELNIDDSEMKNLFFVKDSDLYFEDETEFFESLTDKILGIKTRDLAKIRKELEIRGRITEGGNISDSSVLAKPKSQLRDTRKLIKEIEEYIDYAKEKELDDIERKRFNLELERKELREKIEILREAKKLEEFLHLEEKVKLIEGFISETENLPSEEKVDYYKLVSKEIRDSEDQQPKMLLIRNLEQVKRNNIISSSSFIVLLLITTIVSIFYSEIFLYGIISSSLLLLVSLGFLVYNILLNKKISEKERLENKIMTEINEEFRLPFKTNLEISKFLEDIEEKRRILRDSFMRNVSIFEEIFELENLELKKETLEKIAKDLTEFRKTINFEIDLEYSEKEHDRVRNRLSESDDELDLLIDDLKDHKDSLLDFDKKLNRIDFERFIGEEMELRINNLDALMKTIPLLTKIVFEIESKADISLNIIDIFKVIEKEESEKKEELFKNNDFLTETIKGITNGYIVDIDYISSEDILIVEKSNGTKLNIGQLSYGELTQVLFSIRISLANKYLAEKQGFFIFENPFLSSDDERLNLQFNFLQQLTSLGWQIIFFSSKNEILKKFEQMENKGNLYKLNRL